MGKTSRRHVLGLVGALALAGCQTAARQGSTPTGEPEKNSPELGALSRTEISCLAESDDVHSGWVHTVAHGETHDLTFDVRVAHREGVEVGVDLTERASGENVLAFTYPTPTDRETQEDECISGSRIEGSGRLPLDLERLLVTMNGETLQTLEQSGTLGTMRPLPDPIYP